MGGGGAGVNTGCRSLLSLSLPPPLSLSLSLSLSHTHTHSRARTHTYARTRERAHTNTHTHKHIHTRARARAQIHTHTDIPLKQGNGVLYPVQEATPLFGSFIILRRRRVSKGTSYLLFTTYSLLLERWLNLGCLLWNMTTNSKSNQHKNSSSFVLFHFNF